jgi:predicted DNA-binding ribbon-helix-helix protein
VVQYLESTMPLRTSEKKNARQPRASVTFPPQLYQTLEDLAKRKKVSIAWIVREAAEKYVADQWPLFSGLTGE